MKRVAVVAALFVFAALAVNVQAQTLSDSALDAQTTAIAKQLRCPVCQGESIQDSPAQLAKEMRDVMREQLRAGKTPDEVKAYFVSKYGELILLQPKATGFNLLVYALPWLVVVAGLGVIVAAVRKWTRPAPPAESA